MSCLDMKSCTQCQEFDCLYQAKRYGPPCILKQSGVFSSLTNLEQANIQNIDMDSKGMKEASIHEIP